MTSFFKKKKKQNLPSVEPEQAEAEKVKGPSYVVFISVEKDLIVGAKKTISVPLTLPALPDLEMTYEISVRRADIGVSAVFVPESDGLGRNSEEGGIIPASPRFSAGNGGGGGGGGEVTNKKRASFSSRPSSDGTDSEFDLASSIPGSIPILPYSRVRRRDVVLDGVFRFEGQSGRVIFTLDNSYSKTRRKRVLIKLNVETVDVEADKHELAAELQQIDDLRKAVLAKVPDPAGYLESDMNVKRFLDARPTFDEALAMLTNTLRWRNDAHYFLPGGCPMCRSLPGAHVFRQIGFDKERRPVIFFSLAQVIPRIRLAFRPYELLVHLVNILENGHKTMEPGAAYGFTWILDLQGMSWADCRLVGRITGDMEEGQSRDGTKDAKKESFISVLADHFPQTLGSCVMLRPPVFIMSIWKAVRAFMDPKTAAAYYFVRSPTHIDEALTDLFDQEVGDWIRKEISLVQADPVNGVDDKIFRGPELWKKDPKSGHDPRGSSEYVKRFCCPVDERAEGLDRNHNPHPNICQMIENGTVGGDDATSKTSKSDKPSGGGAAESEIILPGTMSPKQEREEARKLLGITMRQIKAAVDAHEAHAHGKGRNARKRTGISYETLERLSQANVDKSDDGKAEDIETMLDQILKKELCIEEDNDSGDDSGDDDDNDDEIEDSSIDGSFMSADTKKGSVLSGKMKRVVIPSRGVHTEKVLMDSKLSADSTSTLSWSFQVESGDVGFVASFVSDRDPTNVITVTPWSRCRNRLVHQGNWTISSDFGKGYFTLKWDNSYSRIRPKAITFSINR